jgi:hypothetical protein
MASAHLPLEPRRDVLGRELTALVGDDELEGEVEQEIAQLVPNASGIPFAQRMVQLERLLDQVRPERLSRLGPVPGTPGPEIAHHRLSASKR